ncbi:hypothetical protein NLG97_g9612 [Lecanicillium saksenae]|uniref:Uncharacterized protein n=1 Tax=Lecanicillium saksenae TaxID=468837 RepID=A0ACC1QFS4_9HYPO|nr:hypothetical protein NLG97_g9612 [Lecanicillium saksenae]
MDPGTILAVTTFAGKCLSYGTVFVKMCRSYLRADEEAAELLIAIESNWVKMETQIRLMKDISSSLDKPVLDIQARILSQLEGKLKTATLTVDKLMKDKKEADKARLERGNATTSSLIPELGKMKVSKKVRYVFQKSSLYQIVDDIEKWQARYDPMWFIAVREKSNVIDETLLGEQQRSSNRHIPIIIAAKGIHDAVSAASVARDDEARDPIWVDQLALQPSPIPHSTAQRAVLAADSDEEVLIDVVVSHADADAGLTRNAVRNLARILAQVDPSTFGLLKCQGAVRPEGGSNLAVPQSVAPPIFKFIFSIPPNLTEPKSLREVLLSKARYPLDEQLGLAKKIVNSVLFVQTANFVHKNIRPENIIAFKDKNSEIGAPFLVGFEQFRVESARTYRTGDGKWEHNLYRHPSRQGIRPDVDYRMRHDIYSLGVVLLEIGIWTSLVVYDGQDSSCSPRPHEILGSIDVGSGQNGRKSAYKKILESLAETELPSRLGKRYTEVVLRCLRCLDSGHGGDTEVDVGMGYIDDVLEEIHAIML